MTITEFLLARIAEDHESARLAATVDVGTSQPERYLHQPHWAIAEDQEMYYSAGVVTASFATADEAAKFQAEREADWQWETDEVTRHQERFDPARVLAECEVKRRIVEEYSDFETLPPGERVDQRVTLRFVLEHLATVYADHPDYDPDWRPWQPEGTASTA